MALEMATPTNLPQVQQIFLG